MIWSVVFPLGNWLLFKRNRAAAFPLLVLWKCDDLITCLSFRELVTFLRNWAAAFPLHLLWKCDDLIRCLSFRELLAYREELTSCLSVPFSGKFYDLISCHSFRELHTFQQELRSCLPLSHGNAVIWSVTLPSEHCLPFTRNWGVAFPFLVLG